MGELNVAFTHGFELQAQICTLVPKKTCGIQEDFDMKYRDEHAIRWFVEDETWAVAGIQAAEVEGEDADRFSDASGMASPESVLTAALLARGSSSRASAVPPEA